MMGDTEMKEWWYSRAFSVGLWAAIKKGLRTKCFIYKRYFFLSKRVKKSVLRTEKLSKTNSANKGHPFCLKRLEKELGQ